MSDGNQSHQDDFRPTASLEALRLRAGLLRRLRAFFDERGFLEVETPLVSADVVVDRHLDPFAVVLDDPPLAAPRGTLPAGQAAAPPKRGAPRLRWLQTSPEFAMKRLLAAGSGPIYQVAHAFRRGERGRLHNPEFTLAEWYAPGDDLAAGIERLIALVAGLLAGTGAAFDAAERLSFREAFVRHVGLDPHRAGAQELRDEVRRRGIAAPENLAADDRQTWLELLHGELVEPHLGAGRATILYDYPAEQAALARLRPEAPAVAERFELYLQGIELANGYHELLDPEVLAQRQIRENSARAADGKATLPEANRLLAAMRAGLPQAVGVALGFDRVVMLAAGAASLAEVLAFPWERA